MTLHSLILHEYRLPSPVGTILLLHDDDDRLRALDFLDYRDRMLGLLDRCYGRRRWTIEPSREQPYTAQALDRYFAGELAALDQIRTECGGTAFQQSVWRALRTIEPGITRSYGEIALSIGRPTASRAVGAANGANPIAIVVPCHRVIGADGSLTGFGGGLERKRWLIEHEARHCDVGGPGNRTLFG